MTKQILILDVGGTWLKGGLVLFSELDELAINHKPFKAVASERVQSRLSVSARVEDFIGALDELIQKLMSPSDCLMAIGVSTAGIVNYAGSQMLYMAPHLSAIKDNSWIDWLKAKYQVPVTLINDADAVMVAAAALGYLSGEKEVGVMPIGTGLGFSVWRNGRKWTPSYSYTLLGSIATPTGGGYDGWASVTNLSKKHPESNLIEIFTNPDYRDDVEAYLEGLVKIIQTSYYLYHTSHILIGGGLAEVVTLSEFPLEERLNKLLEKEPLINGLVQSVTLLKEGNSLAILGAALVAYGESIAQERQMKVSMNLAMTEKPYDPTLVLHKMEPNEIVQLLWKAEQEAGVKLHQSLEGMSRVVTNIVERLKDGGRLIYVGAGTSGRLAAIDTVEIACTFGFPRSRVLTLIAGGVADASIDIETNFEEDASSIPDILITGLSNKDVVVGISMSGSAYYVQSALGYAKHIGAYSVLIQEADIGTATFCDDIIALFSGSEILAGSTRMKAGTATKKVLNFISTTTMILLGKVYGSYMIGLECTNEKLVVRAQRILMTLFRIDQREALAELERHNYVLSDVIVHLEKSQCSRNF